jgi:RNA polymerase sigma-70 factor (ECF subfamily)
VSAGLTIPVTAVVEFDTATEPCTRPRRGGANEAALLWGDWTIPQLTAGVCRGDEAAVRALHAHYCERLTRYVLVVTGGHEATASEIVQTAFLRALRHLRPLPDEPALWAWLARAARTAAADAHRRSRRYSALLGRVATLFSRADHSAPEDTESIWLRALEKALAELSDDARALIEARYFERRPLAQVAAEQSSTDRAIEGRLARVRDKLRRSILQQLSATTRHDS